MCKPPEHVRVGKLGIGRGKDAGRWVDQDLGVSLRTGMGFFFILGGTKKPPASLIIAFRSASSRFCSKLDVRSSPVSFRSPHSIQNPKGR
jgi:hypothetical protein